MIGAAVIGVSAGVLTALVNLLSPLPAELGFPCIVVQHVREGAGGYLPKHLNAHCKLRVKEADEKEAILPNTVYVAPAGYHLLVEEDKTFSLSDDPKV